MDPDIVEHLLEIKGTLGELKSQGQNTLAYVSSVSEGQKTLRREFDAHIGATNAHGADVTEKRDSKWMSLLALGVSAAVAAWGVIEKNIAGHP